MTFIRAELFTKPECGLCDEMKKALERASRGVELRLTETDITTSEALLERYGHDIPVLYLNGEKAFEHRATERQIRERLLALKREP